MKKTLNADDVTRFIGQALDNSLKDPDLLEKFKKVKILIKVITTDPNAVMIMSLADNYARNAQADEPADATLKMKLETANKFWQGKINVIGAMALGTIKAQGNIPALISVLPLATKLFPAYVAALKEADRTDMIVK